MEHGRDDDEEKHSFWIVSSTALGRFVGPGEKLYDFSAVAGISREPCSAGWSSVSDRSNVLGADNIFNFI